MTAPTRFWPALVYLAMLAVGIPWYWPANDTSVWLGMPAWVVVAILVGAAASLFTLWLLKRPWPDEAQP